MLYAIYAYAYIHLRTCGLLYNIYADVLICNNINNIYACILIHVHNIYVHTYVPTYIQTYTLTNVLTMHNNNYAYFNIS